MQGFRARVQKSGKTYYYFDVGGKPRREIPLGSDYVTAVRKWADLTAQQNKAEVVTNFKELADRYERDHLPTLAKSTQATQKGDIKMLLEFFCTPSPAPLDQIKPSHIYKLMDWKKSQPTTANRLKRVFSAMFNLARQWGYTEKMNPCTGIRGLEIRDKRSNYVEDEVYQAIWKAGSEPLQDAMDLAYLTGQRPGDTLTMTERDISNGVLMVDQGKTGAKLRIRIEGQLATVIERIQARKARYKVWSANLAVNTRGLPMTKQTLRDQFEAARKAAAEANKELAEQIKRTWFYDLRKKASSDTADKAGIQAAADLLGHTSTTTTKSHYDPRGRLVSPTK